MSKHVLADQLYLGWGENLVIFGLTIPLLQYSESVCFDRTTIYLNQNRKDFLLVDWFFFYVKK